MQAIFFATKKLRYRFSISQPLDSFTNRPYRLTKHSLNHLFHLFFPLITRIFRFLFFFFSSFHVSTNAQIIRLRNFVPCFLSQYTTVTVAVKPSGDKKNNNIAPWAIAPTINIVSTTAIVIMPAMAMGIVILLTPFSSTNPLKKSTILRNACFSVFHMFFTLASVNCGFHIAQLKNQATNPSATLKTLLIILIFFSFWLTKYFICQYFFIFFNKKSTCQTQVLNSISYCD